MYNYIKEVKKMIERKDYYKTRIFPNLDKIYQWAKLGMTDVQICRNLNIAKRTFVKYLETEEELRQVLAKGRGGAESEIENALFKRAIGYEYTEVHEERVLVKDPITGESNYKMVVTKKIKKHNPPDVSAIKYWLEHRDPKRWHYIESNVDDEKEIEVIVRRKGEDDSED